MVRGERETEGEGGYDMAGKKSDLERKEEWKRQWRKWKKLALFYCWNVETTYGVVFVSKFACLFIISVNFLERIVYVFNSTCYVTKLYMISYVLRTVPCIL